MGIPALQSSSSISPCWLKHVTAICCQMPPGASRAQPHLDFSYQPLVIFLAMSLWKTICLQEHFSFVGNRRQQELPSSHRTRETSSPTLASCSHRAWAEIRPHSLGLSSAFADVVQIHPLHGHNGGQAEIREGERQGWGVSGCICKNNIHAICLPLHSTQLSGCREASRPPRLSLSLFY